MKKPVRALIYIFAALILALLGVLALNFYDPPLRPEVRKILQRELTASPEQTRAFFFVLGLYAGEKNDPEKKGEELWPQRDRPGFWDDLMKNDPWKNDFNGCGTSPCGVKNLEEDPKLLDVLKLHQETVTNFIHLMQYETGADIFMGSRQNPLAHLQMVPYPLHRLFLLQLAQWIRQGGEDRALDVLASSNRYFSGFFNQGTFLDRLMAVAGVKANLRFLLQEAARDPKLRITREFLNSVHAPEPDSFLYDAMESELRSFDNIVHSRLSIGDFEFTEESGLKWASFIPARAFLRPNETLNQYYELFSEGMTADCPIAKLGDCVPALQWTDFDRPWKYFANPAGRILIRMMAIQVPRYRMNLKKSAQDILEMKSELQEHLRE